MSRGIKHISKKYDGFKNVEDREEINPTHTDKESKINEQR